jgi:hypothetical protein
MRVLSVVFFFLISVGAIACSGPQKPLCLVKALRIGDNLICGVISAKSGHSLEINVIDVLYGVETRSAITVWDGTDFICTGTISMKVTDMGNVGDTIISVLPLISSVPQNTWDVVGDYRRPYSLFETAWVMVKNDSVRGYIAGSNSAPLVKYAYSGFKSYWISHSNECLTLSVKESIFEKIDVLLFENRITIRSVSDERFSANLYSIDGRPIQELAPAKQLDINCSNLPDGIYILTLRNDVGAFLTKKITLW